MTRKHLIAGYAALRIGYAVALIAAPGRTARPWVGADAERPAATIGMRGLGARDLALAAGALAAALTDKPDRPWLAACAASDAVDLAATLVVDGEALPSRAKIGTVAAAGGFGAAGAALAAWGR
jgi:hypothetical protein